MSIAQLSALNRQLVESPAPHPEIKQTIYSPAECTFSHCQSEESPLFSSPELSSSCEASPFFLKTLAYKALLVWNRIYGEHLLPRLIKIDAVVRSVFSPVVANPFFFPLKWPLIANIKAVRSQLKIEAAYYRDFWDPSKPLDPNLKDHALIREKFALPQDRIIPIQLKDGKSANITCRVIQTKESGETFYNFVQVPGIYTTISNNIGAIHPYLAAYLNAGKQGSAPPARFIMISENDLDIKPSSLEEAGWILLQTLKALKKEFGEIDQLVAHSLGTIFLASALKQADDPTELPNHLCFDRGPTSIWETSKHYFLGLGRLIYFLAKWGGWNADIEEEIVLFCQKWQERPSMLITGVVQDHHFSGSANLCLGQKLKQIEDIDILVFDPPNQIVHERAHHNLRSDHFNSKYLVNQSDFLEPMENLPEAIIRSSLPMLEKQGESA